MHGQSASWHILQSSPSGTQLVSPTCRLTLALSLVQPGTSKAMVGRCTTPTFAAKQQLTVSQSGHKPTPRFGQPYLVPQKRSTTVPAASVWITCLRNATRIQGVKKFPDEDAGPTTSRTLARHGVQPICKSWNYSHCVSATCAYRHVCLECRENHRIVQCPTNRRFQPYPKAKPWRRRKGNGQEAGLSWPAGFQPPLSHTTLRKIMH